MAVSRGVGVAAIRAAARKRADEESLRSTAEEIGMSYTAFRHFLKGGDPHPATREKLAGWYAAHRTGTRKSLPKSDVQIAVRLIREYIAAGTTSRIREARLAEVVELVRAEGS
jgi:hypothetical protein